jgi:tRNA(Ile)-lysidine synthase
MFSPEQAVQRLLHSLSKPVRVLVAVSGGSDSLGLLTLLAEMRNEPLCDGVSFSAATIDHALRPNSADEADRVAAFCAARGIAHTVRRWEGPKPAAGLSAAAREARYDLLTDIAEQEGATVIVTGHTLDDQRETVTMRSARNDDSDSLGLAGMAQLVLLRRKYWLLRPFLASRRADIRAALVGRGIAWIDDPSNVNTAYERVRVRQALASEAVSVSREIEEAGHRRHRLSQAAATFLQHYCRVGHGVLAVIDKRGLDLDPGVLLHALAALAAVLGGREHRLAGKTLDRISAFLQDGQPGRTTAGRVIFDLRRDGLYLQRERRGLPALEVNANAEAIWDGRFCIRNGNASPLQVRAASLDRAKACLLFADVPASIATRAMSVMPDLVETESQMEGHTEVSPIMAPFERFLPFFEFDLARQIALLIGCEDFPPIPIQVSERKS